MPNIRPLNKDKYEISKHRFLELYHFCMQYNDWKEELKSITSAVKSTPISGMPSSHNYQDQTAKLVEKRMKLAAKCELIEQTAIEADPELYPYILEGVTCDYATYRYLKMSKDMPCGKNMYYDRRRKFYFLLSIKK